ncbi:hypothetical protein EDM52_02130 [Brevibacillus invocatus]|uniref:SbsA Ig-like domain-containing protein n=1 Tax=Brevibacillus invocatus TaxID=173959 RepID=A0A3M8CM44_9BACL|nr:hypothetical protein [Brevibacillus invocatus]RNB76708.1 hypothetical protein EDM52_02130 [Brevibacillus invocatus]
MKIDTTVATAALQDDKKTVVLTFAANQSGKSHTLVVSGVKNADKSKTLAAVTKVVSFDDTTAPTVKTVEYTSAGKVVVTFSEPMDTSVTPIFRVNGAPVTASFVSGSKTQIEASVTLAKGSTATVYVAAAKDVAGNEMGLFNGSVVVPNDTTAPSITSVTQVAQDTVRIVLNEALGTTGALDLVSGDVKVLKGTTVISHVAGTTDIAVTKNTTVDPTGKTYDVQLDLNGATAGDGIFAAGSTTQDLTFMIDAGAFGDAYGNTNASLYSKTLTLTADSTGPAFVSSAVASNKQTFEITFNKAIGTTTDKTKIVVTDANGVRYTVDSATRATDTKVLVVDLYSGTTVIPNGTYTIKLGAGSVVDAYTNANVEATTTVVVGDASDVTAPVATIDNVQTTGPADVPNKFLVSFDEKVTSATALNKANYKLDGADLPAGTDVYFTDSTQTKVQIDLPANSINIGEVGTGTNANLSVSGVKDEAGNTAAAKSAAVLVEDNTAAVLESAQLIGDTLVLNFNENLLASFATGADIDDILGDFVITGGTATFAKADVIPTDDTADGGAQPATGTVSIDGKKLVINIVGNDSNWSTVKAASTLKVKTDATALKDANKLLVKDAVEVTVSK